MEFKAYTEGRLNCYLGVMRPAPLAAGAAPEGSGGNPEGTRNRLREYVNWAAVLSEGKSLWVMVRETPESAKEFRTLAPVRVAWKYDVVANDTEGVGVDKGFVPVEAPYSALHSDQGSASLLFRVPDLRLLLQLTEDALGDVGSHVTVLALQQEDEALVDKLKGNHAPQLTGLLQGEDLLVNVVVGKEQGYYDTFLLKSQESMEEALFRLTS